eukprot:988445-Rhodomonas_salina.1
MDMWMGSEGCRLSCALELWMSDGACGAQAMLDVSMWAGECRLSATSGHVELLQLLPKATKRLRQNASLDKKGGRACVHVSHRRQRERKNRCFWRDWRVICARLERWESGGAGRRGGEDPLPIRVQRAHPRLDPQPRQVRVGICVVVLCVCVRVSRSGGLGVEGA